MVTLELREGAKGIFGALDVDNDQRLSVREMRRAPLLIRELDRNKDQSLSIGEVRQQYRAHFSRGLGNPSSPAVYSDSGEAAAATSQNGPKWFQRMDRNRDGDVSPKEFLGKQAQFRKLDKDNNRLISVEEAQRAEQRYRR